MLKDQVVEKGQKHVLSVGGCSDQCAAKERKRVHSRGYHRALTQGRRQGLDGEALKEFARRAGREECQRVYGEG